jgi:hypothetical protein
MSDKLDKVIEGLLAVGEEKAKCIISDTATALRHTVQKSDEPWKKAVVAILASAIEREGAEGLRKAKAEVEKMLSGKKADLSFVDLEAQSKALTVLQKIEASEKAKAKVYSAAACEIARTLLYGFVKSALI